MFGKIGFELGLLFWGQVEVFNEFFDEAGDFSNTPLAALPLSAGATTATKAPDACEAVDLISSATAPQLAEALASEQATIRRAVLDSSSLADLEARLKKAFPKLDYSKSSALAQDALAVSSLNGLAEKG